MTKQTSCDASRVKIQMVAGLTGLLLASVSMAQTANSGTGTPGNSPTLTKEMAIFQPKDDLLAEAANSPSLQSRPQALGAIGAGKSAASRSSQVVRSASKPPRLSMRCNPGKTPNQVGVCQ